MMTPLAFMCAGRHFTFMRSLFFIFICVCLGLSAFAQETPQTDIPAPKLEGPEIEVPALPQPKTEEDKVALTPDAGKDLTVRSEAGRAKMLGPLFLNLKHASDAESGKLIAEEIWAVFLQSGSASVDFVLLRGISAQSRGDLKLARRMFDHVTHLQPEYAEGWSRSARLAIQEDDLNRAVAEATQSLRLEPRHFYALWTLGNILEKLGKPDEAYEAYSEAHKLYPEHEEIKERVEFLKESALGKAL